MSSVADLTKHNNNNSLSLFHWIDIERIDGRRMNRLNILVFTELQAEDTPCRFAPHQFPWQRDANLTMLQELQHHCHCCHYIAKQNTPETCAITQSLQDFSYKVLRSGSGSLVRRQGPRTEASHRAATILVLFIRLMLNISLVLFYHKYSKIQTLT